MMRLPFESPEAKQLNLDIFETIYFGAVEASVELAEKDGHYETYQVDGDVLVSVLRWCLCWCLWGLVCVGGFDSSSTSPTFTCNRVFLTIRPFSTTLFLRIIL